MNAREYIDATKRISPPRLAERKDRLSLYAIGGAGEMGEVCEIIKKHLFHDRPLDAELLMKEVVWYLARLVDCATASVFDLGDVMDMNIRKLAERHPNGWQPHYESDRVER